MNNNAASRTFKVPELAFPILLQAYRLTSGLYKDAGVPTPDFERQSQAWLAKVALVNRVFRYNAQKLLFDQPHFRHCACDKARGQLRRFVKICKKHPYLFEMVRALSLVPTGRHEYSWGAGEFLSDFHSTFVTSAKRYQGKVLLPDGCGERLATLVLEHGQNMETLHVTGELNIHPRNRIGICRISNENENIFH